MRLGMGLQDRPDAFQEALARLQVLYDHRVSHLTAEVTKLRAELEGQKTKIAFSPKASCEATQSIDSGITSRHQIATPMHDGQQVAAPMHDKPRWRPTVRTCSYPRKSRRASAESKRSVRSIRTMLAYNLRPEFRQARESCQGHKIGRMAHAYSQWTLAAGQQTSYKGWSGACKRLVEKQYFDVIMGIIIIGNTICISVETSFNRAGKQTPTALHILEYCFLSLYTLELAMRLVAHGVIRALKSNWVKFDTLLVFFGLVDIAVKVVTMGGTLQILDKVFVVRILRLARLARVFRLMMKFPALWMLVQGLLNSLSTLVWTTAMICTLLYVFSVLGLEMLEPDPDAGVDYNRVVATHFSNLTNAMLALLQGLTLDSFSGIYRPLVLARPLTILYFAPFMLIVPIALMSLVTALMVNFSLDQADKDRKEQEELKNQRKAAMVDLLKEMFQELDTDGSGCVDLAEMLNAPEEVRALIFEIAELPRDPEASDTEDLQEIFEVMDLDGSGDVEANEFCEGLLKLQDGRALESLRIMKQCTQMMLALKNMTRSSTQHAQQDQVQHVSPTPSVRPSFSEENSHVSQALGLQDVKEGERAPEQPPEKAPRLCKM